MVLFFFQRIDLRDNNINLAGLMALARSMKVNTSVTRLDLDDEPKTKKVTITFNQMLLFHLIQV